MAHYLVRARPRPETLEALERALAEGAFDGLEPFGRALTEGLRDARIDEAGTAFWEEEDYCRPPLKEERAAVLDRHFADIAVEAVAQGEGRARIAHLPRLFPRLAGVR